MKLVVEEVLSMAECHIVAAVIVVRDNAARIVESSREISVSVVTAYTEADCVLSIVSCLEEVLYRPGLRCKKGIAP